ncbi:MAG: hypothetical protein MJK12_12100 [Colwellia sp.]|nr:hypothetical protein [Colwellia sp.]
MSLPEDNNGNSKRTIDTKERKKLRNAIEEAVLSPVFSNDQHEENSPSYLRLIHSADIAHKECADLLSDAVHQARRLQHSWTAIGDVLGISRQAAQQRFNPNAADTTNTTSKTTHRIAGANAFNEMELLKVQGKAGNHLVGFGPLCLLVEESKQQWQHKRLISFSWQTQENMEAKGWTYVGAWIPFQYYKRSINKEG